MEEQNIYILNDKQVRGVDMVIKAISRKFKFVKGWEVYEGYENYASVLFINLIMDYQEFADTYNYYTKRSLFRRTSSSSIGAQMGRSEQEYNKPYEEKEDLYAEIKIIRDDIERSIKQLYDNLPEEFVSHFSTDFFPELKHPRVIMVSEYIDTHIPKPF
jgi:hypothetical protein